MKSLGSSQRHVYNENKYIEFNCTGVHTDKNKIKSIEITVNVYIHTISTFNAIRNVSVYIFDYKIKLKSNVVCITIASTSLKLLYIEKKRYCLVMKKSSCKR